MDENNSEKFLGKVEDAMTPSRELEVQHQKELQEIQRNDAAEFMRKAGAGFVAEQYRGIRETSELIGQLELKMYAKADKDDADLDTIMKVHSQLTRKADNQAKNVLRLYQGTNVESSPLLKKTEGANDGISKASEEASSKEMSMMSSFAMILQALTNQNNQNNNNNGENKNTPEG